jgi:MFS superfamily sulfate permease-like transporter
MSFSHGLILRLSFWQTFVVAKHYAQQAGEVISPNRELVALGLSNVFGSLFGAYPASGSLSRSKVNHDAGMMMRLNFCFHV